MTRHHPFPIDSFHLLAQHALFQPFCALLPGLEELRTWPAPDAWNSWAREREDFQQRAGDLRFVEEIRPGSRRMRREKKLARLQSPAGLRSYEARVIEHGEVATRPEHPHDFFNALVWLLYPASKRRLHELAYQLQQSASEVPLGQRSREADSLTCFDEGGVYYHCQPEQNCAELRRLFASRDDEAKAKFCRNHRTGFAIFGHGLLEGLLVNQLAEVQVSCLVLPFHGEEPKPNDLCLAAQIQQSVWQRGDWGTVPFSALWTAIDSIHAPEVQYKPMESKSN